MNMGKGAKVLIFVLLSFLVASLLLTGCASSNTSTTPVAVTTTNAVQSTNTSSSATGTGSTKTLNLGGVAMLTGPASQGGLAYQQGWQLIVDKVNAAGGLKVGNDTYKINLIVEDDQMSTSQAATATTLLIQQYHCPIILSSLIDTLKTVEYPITSKAGVLLVESDGISNSGALPYPGNADVSPNKPLLIRTQHAYSDTTAGVIGFLEKDYPNVKTVELNGVTQDSTPPLADQVVQELKKYGLSQVGPLEQYAPDISDFTPLMSRILANKPDAIFDMAGPPIALGSETKAARQLGFTGPMFSLTKGDVALQEQISGPNTTDMFAQSFTLADPNRPQAIKDVEALYLKKYPKQDLISDVIGAYNGLWVLLQTIQKAGSIDPTTIENTYESMTKPGDIQTVYGPAYVGGLKTLGVNRAIVEPFAISIVKNGVPSIAGWYTYNLP